MVNLELQEAAIARVCPKQRTNSAILLIWLWRDYDPSKTTQEFVQEDSEAAKPLWRVVTMNRR
jgi:hypothetical protein